MPWFLLAAFALGGGWLLVSRAAAERSPSGEPWPVGVSSASVHDAVLFALAHETHAGKLRAFAVQLAPYDVQASSTLNLRAAVLDPSTTTNTASPYLPNQGETAILGAQTGAQSSTFTSTFTRRA